MTIPIPPAAYNFLATQKAVGDNHSILRRLELLGLKVKPCDPPAEEIVDGPGVAADLPEYRAGPCKACKFWKQSDSYAKYLSVETKEAWGKCASAEAAVLIEGNIARAVGDPRATSGGWPLAVGGAVTREDFGCAFFGEPEQPAHHRADLREEGE